MSILERIVGAIDAGPLLGRLARMIGTDRAAGDQEGSTPQHSAAFTIAVVALGAKMAKADGLVTREEVDAFKEVFKAPADQVASVGRVFDLARQDVAGYQEYASQIAGLFRGNRPLLNDVLDGLFNIASADGALYPAEEQFLSEVARRFGLTDSEYRFARAKFVIGAEPDPFSVLELAADATNEEIKAQHRRLVGEHHPDRAIARGLPREAIEIANRKLAAINEAYDILARERGIS